MVGVSRRHAAALDQLVEWWQDLSRQEINSQAVLLPVPSHWGRTYLLNQFTAVVEEDEAISIVITVRGAGLPDGLGLQAEALRELFKETGVEHRVAELLGVDRLGGVIQLGLGTAGLFASPLAALVGLLLASVGVGAAGRVWDDSPAGQEGRVAKLGRAVAAVSVSVPVVVIIDDADLLEPDLAVTLVENLIERADGQVLVVAAVKPDENALSALTSRVYGITEDIVQALDVDPEMDYQARAGLAADLCPQLPAVAIRRIGQRTQTFAEVFAVAAAERLTDLGAHDDETIAVALVDEVVNAKVSRTSPSREAVALAWAGGILHARQVRRAVEVMGESRTGDNGDVLQFASLVRLADPASPRLAEQVRVLTVGERHQLAETIFQTAVEIGADRGIGLVEKVVAWQAAHRVRADLENRKHMASMQCQLAHGLEDLDDPEAAFQVAETALAEYPARQPGKQQTSEYDDLAATVLRLAGKLQSKHDDSLVKATVAAVAAGGAAVGLEARIWAAIDLLAQPGQSERALQLIDEIGATLSRGRELGVIGDRWRLLLAFHVGRAGYPAITQQLLAPMLDTSSPPEDEDAARAVLYAVGGLGADTRLQIVGLEAELAALPPDADDDRLRIHHVLATDYIDLGDYRRALHHGRQEVLLRQRVQGPNHRDTLTARNMVAWGTKQSGRSAEALRLYKKLLRDQQRVLGRDDPDTLISRNGVALCIADTGNHARALRLYQDILRDRERVRGPNHPETLNTLNNIAAITAQLGDHATAVVLFQDLLMRDERVRGPKDPDTLMTRNNLATQIGLSGDPARGARLFQELLADLKRILDPDHPHILAARANMAALVRQNGDRAEALRLYRELLPDQERALGQDHPATRITRRAIRQLDGRG